MNEFERARLNYRPDPVRVVLVAEAPPAEDSERFFYFEEVPTGDSLFLEVMKALYVDARGATKRLRERKKEFLERFRDDGFYLLDASSEPIPSLRQAVKIRYVRAGLDQLQCALSEIQNSELKIVLISAPVYKVCSSPLRQGGWNVINSEMIDFPGRGRQKLFQAKFGQVITHI